MFGTADRIQTCDLDLRIVALYPLSYSRVEKVGRVRCTPSRAESLFDVNQSIQQSIETTYDRKVTYVFSNLLQGLEFF